jgi:2,4-dienoyl-CoA reductase-like NADH-dependent reductase (Old Yellow Enzyme family)
MSTNNPLFSPFQHKSLSLPNRIVMAPMTRSKSPGGVPAEDVATYYRRRAEGGVGLIITEGTTVDRAGASNDENIPISTRPRVSRVGAAWRRKSTPPAERSRRRSGIRA